MHNRIKECLIIALAILSLGLFIYKAQIDAKNFDRVVTVRGLSEKTVNADFCIWPIVFNEVGDDLTEMYASVEKKTEAVVKFLRDNGVDQSEISLSSPDITDNRRNIYEDQVKVARFSATVVVTVASSKVDLLRSLMGKQSELIKQGIAFTENDYRYHKVYSFNGLNDIKPAMIEEATKNARVAADKFAKDSQSKLGKIKNATQGLFSVTDRDESTPHVKNVRVVTNVQYFLED